MDVTKELMIEHARRYGFFIHPSVTKNWDEWLKAVNALGHCLCCPSRPQCPCYQSVEEIRNGKRHACTCTVFVDEQYINKYSYTLGLAKEAFFKPGP